jgi:hypothetical protein
MALNTTYAQTLHRHVVMWVDEHVCELGNNEAMKNRFRRITYPLETFTQVQPAIDFIRQQQSAQRSVFLIVSGRLALEIVPEIFDLECVTQIFLFCAHMSKYNDWGIDYVKKLFMFDSDEELLIRLTNDIANYLTEETNRENRVERAAGLLDWADWLYNDADTLQQAACKAIRQNIRKRREKLNIDHQIVHPNQFNN